MNENSQIFQIIFIRSNCVPTVLRDPRRSGTGKIGWLMSRVHITSRWPIIQSERMDSWEHEDRSSFGGGSQSSSRTIRSRDHDTIFLEWWNLFLGHDRERISTWRRWLRRPKESTGELGAKARPKQTSTPTTSSTTTLPYDQRDWIDVEQKDDQITSSQHWSIRIWLNNLQKKRRPKKRFQYCVEPFHADSIFFVGAIQGHSGGKHINPTLQDTTGRLRRAHLPRWKLPRHALHHPIRIDSWWKRHQERDRSSEAEVISLDAGWRMDGIPAALDLWDSVTELFHSSPNQAKKARDILQSHMKTCRVTPHSTWKSKIQPSTSIWIWLMLITFHQTWNLLVQCYFLSLRTMKSCLRR